MTSDGTWHPPFAPVVTQQKSSGNGCLWGLAIGAVALLIVPVLIIAVTFLGRSASAKFTSVGTAINDPAYSGSGSGSGSGRSAFQLTMSMGGLTDTEVDCLVDYLDSVGFSYPATLSGTAEAQFDAAMDRCVF